jgi:hypothetical protein
MRQRPRTNDDRFGLVALKLARDALRPRVATEDETCQPKVSAVGQGFARKLHDRRSIQYHVVGRTEPPHGLARRVDEDREFEVQPIARPQRVDDPLQGIEGEAH